MIARRFETLKANIAQAIKQCSCTDGNLFRPCGFKGKKNIIRTLDSTWWKPLAVTHWRAQSQWVTIWFTYCRQKAECVYHCHIVRCVMEMNKAASQLLPEAACGGRDVDLWLKHSEAGGSGVPCCEDLVGEVVESVNFNLVPDRAETFDSLEQVSYCWELKPAGAGLWGRPCWISALKMRGPPTSPMTYFSLATKNKLQLNILENNIFQYSAEFSFCGV